MLESLTPDLSASWLLLHIQTKWLLVCPARPSSCVLPAESETVSVGLLSFSPSFSLETGPQATQAGLELRIPAAAAASSAGKSGRWHHSWVFRVRGLCSGSLPPRPLLGLVDTKSSVVSGQDIPEFSLLVWHNSTRRKYGSNFTCKEKHTDKTIFCCCLELRVFI